MSMLSRRCTAVRVSLCSPQFTRQDAWIPGLGAAWGGRRRKLAGATHPELARIPVLGEGVHGQVTEAAIAVAVAVFVRAGFEFFEVSLQGVAVVVEGLQGVEGVGGEVPRGCDV